VRQALPVYDKYVAQEHNEMTQVLRDVAAALGDTTGPEADRIRARAATLGALPNVPMPAPARYNPAGDPRPPAPTIRTLAALSFFCPSIPMSFIISWREYLMYSSLESVFDSIIIILNDYFSLFAGENGVSNLNLKSSDLYSYRLPNIFSVAGTV
jgi:hypothetical protein